jgi:hypothetical protein
MEKNGISYQKSGYFSALIIDYLDQKQALKSLYKRFPSIENAKEQIAEKEQHFKNNKRREILVSELEQQYIFKKRKNLYCNHGTSIELVYGAFVFFV